MTETLPQPSIPVTGGAASLDPSDASLLLAVGAQDPEAFRLLYDRFAGRLLAYVQAMGRGRLPAEDLVQDVFVAIWRKAAQYRPAVGTPEAWIFTITRNKVLDIWRSHSPVVDRGELDLETLMDGTSTPDPALVATVHKALKGLPEDQRRPLILAYFDGYTYEEAAGRLGVPVGTLKSRIRLALSQLKNLMGEP
jgi:RNA polymerase sigma-70 factor (ECF subfamily)